MKIKKQAPNFRTYQALNLFDKDKAVIISALNSDLEDRIEASQVHFWFEHKWFTVDLAMSCIATVTWKNQQMIAGYLSHDGIFITDDGESDAIAEILDDSDDGPSELVQMRKVRCIENNLVAVGMARLAYRKILPDGKWVGIDKELFAPREERTTAVGLNDVLSDGEGGLLAVGYKGEIWRMKANGSWQLEGSPTNVYLSSIAKHPTKDEFTIVGLKGVIIKGSPRIGWTLLDILPNSDFWSVTYFKDKIFVASDSGLFTIETDDVKAIDFGASESITTRFLDSCATEVWSVGDNHIFSSQDGVEWVEVSNP